MYLVDQLVVWLKLKSLHEILIWKGNCRYATSWNADESKNNEHIVVPIK